MHTLTPSLQDITCYLDVVFGYVDYMIPCRSFAEKGNDDTHPPHSIWLANNEQAAENLLHFAQWANQQHMACYVIPGSVKAHGQASSEHILQMQTLLVDLDTGDIEAKLTMLTHALLQPTLIVESGGITAEGQKKLHVYWKLTEPAEGEALKRLLQLRHHIALTIGGDAHFKSAHQPIRVAGSIYHKGGKPKAVCIRQYHDVEYDLDDLVELSEALPRSSHGTTHHKGEAFLDFNTVAPSTDTILTRIVHEGGEGEHTRFNYIQKVIGHWLACYYDGLISDSQAWERITGYNTACVEPSFEEKKLKEMVKGLWKVHVGKYGMPEHLRAKESHGNRLDYFTVSDLVSQPMTIPEDIIAPRILTPGGIWLLAGPPKIGKSDFLLNLFTHAAAGVDFLWFKFLRPLRIFYVQAEVEKPYLYERYMNVVQSNQDLFEKGKDNLVMTAKFNFQFDEQGVNEVIDTINHTFCETDKQVDIIAIDPFRNIYESGLTTKGDINEELMAFFRQRLEQLLAKTHPKAGLLLVHHTNKITAKMLEDDPFNAVSGGGALLSYPVSLTVLGKADHVNPPIINAWFDIRNGKPIDTKVITKNEHNQWTEISRDSVRITNIKRGELQDAEDERRRHVILEFLYDEARKGNLYTSAAAAVAVSDLGKGMSESTARRLIRQYETLGDLRFIASEVAMKEYGLPHTTSCIGYLVAEGMVRDAYMDDETGEMIPEIEYLPTHFRESRSTSIIKLKDEHIRRWKYYDDIS